MTVHAIATRFEASGTTAVSIPHTGDLPIFSDNVIPSLLIHLGVIDLTTTTPSLNLSSVFLDAGRLERLLASPQASSVNSSPEKSVPKEGPILNEEQAFVLRASAIDACELIVSTAHSLEDDEVVGTDGTNLSWLKDITLPEVDAWLWSVAKDRPDYRALERFVQRATTYY